MDFPHSTHKNHWIFSQEQLLECLLRTLSQAEKYASVHQAAAASVGSCAPQDGAGGAAVAALPQPGDDAASVTPPVSIEKAALLRRFFEGRIKAVCDMLHLPHKVQATAAIFFKRFYTRHSVLEHDPQRMMATCIYIACKVEESYIHAEELCKRVQGLAKPEAMLRLEVPLLQGLQFDLVVHNPYRPLDGLWELLERLHASNPGALDEPLLHATPEALQKARRGAMRAVDAILLTDAPLRFAPGVLAAAAMRSGCRAAGLPSSRFVEHIAAASFEEASRAAAAVQEQQQGGSGGGGAGAQPRPGNAQEALGALLGSLGQVDAMVTASMAQEEGLEAAAGEVDRKIKIWRKAAASGAGGGAAPGGASAGGA